MTSEQAVDREILRVIESSPSGILGIHLADRVRIPISVKQRGESLKRLQLRGLITCRVWGDK